MLNTTLIFTRVPSHTGAATQGFAAAGVEVLDFPLQHIGPPGDLARFHAALAALPQTDLAIPVSPTAVAAVFAALQGVWPARCAIGVVGEGSLSAVRRALATQPEDAPWPRLIAPQPGEASGAEGDSEALWEALQLAFPPGPVSTFPWAGRHALIFRGGAGRDLLQHKLESAGAKVRVVEAYSRLAPEYGAHTAGLLRKALGSGGWWLFSSSEAVRNLQRLLEQAGLGSAVLRQQRALAIHGRIAQALQAAGFGRVELTRAPPEAVLSALQRLEAPSASHS